MQYLFSALPENKLREASSSVYLPLEGTMYSSDIAIHHSSCFCAHRYNNDTRTSSNQCGLHETIANN